MASNISFPGIGSGIDGSRFAKAAFDQATLSNVVHQNSIQNLSKENSSLERLRTFLLDLADKLEAIRSVNGGASVKSASVANEDVAAAVAGSEAQAGSFSVTVTSLAATASGSFDRGFSSADEAIISDPGASGTVSFSVGTGEEAKNFSVFVGPTTTAQQFVDQFNEEAEGAANARLVNLGTEDDPEYRISFSSVEAGIAQGSINVEVGNSGLLESDTLGGTTLEQATNAVFSVSGIAGTFERATNTVDDVVAGVTISLQGTGTTQVSIEQAPGVTAAQLESFVASFNALAEFVNKEDKIEVTEQNGETVNIYGTLASTSVDDNVLSTIRFAILDASAADGSTSLASLGVSTELDGTLSFDRERFEEAFKADPTGAAEAFTALADRVGGVDGIVHQYTGYGLFIDQAVTGNENEMEDLNNEIASVERVAAKKEEAVLRQFTGLEGLLAQLNAEASYIAGLLQF